MAEGVTVDKPWERPIEDVNTEGWNPVSVERAILSAVNESAHGVAAATRAYEAYLEAERTYKRAYATAFMTHHGPQTEKKVAAGLVDAVLEAETIRDATDVAYKYAKEMNEVFGKKLDALRSVGVSVRQAYENAGRGNW